MADLSDSLRLGTREGVSALRQRVQALKLRAAHLQGVAAAEQAQFERLTQDVAQAKARAGLHDEVQRVFQALQDRAHERSVGVFERLLSAILKDVLPEEGQVRLLPQLKAGAPALDLALEKDGRLEDILDGNGGAVTNVICAGLRFAALSRTGNRKFLVLDEPDCWLKPERVPAFFRVVSQVSASSRIQTMFISHHSLDKFEGLCNVVELRQTPQGEVYAHALQPLVSDWPDDDTPGIRAIELVNVRRHAHTVIPCFPGATALIGDNNLGKSTAVVSALRAVGYGESDDTLIRHGEEECRIVVHLEQGKRIEMSRKVGRTPAVIYRLWQGTELVTEGRPAKRNQAPDWVVSTLGITRADELDVQLGNQKTPVFLLNDTASRRAQILSVGRESGHLRVLLKHYEDLRVQDRETVRQGEATLARLAYRQRFLSRVAPAQESVAQAASRSEVVLDTLDRLAQLRAVLERIEQLGAAVARSSRQAAVLAAVPQVPALRETASLQAALAKLETLRRRTQVPPVPALPEVPALRDNRPLLELGQKISVLSRRLRLLSGLPPLPQAVPQLSDPKPLEQWVSELQRRKAQQAQAAEQSVQVERELKAAEASLEQLKQSLGGHCPLCGSAFPESGVEHHVH